MAHVPTPSELQSQSDTATEIFSRVAGLARSSPNPAAVEPLTRAANALHFYQRRLQAMGEAVTVLNQAPQADRAALEARYSETYSEAELAVDELGKRHREISGLLGQSLIFDRAMETFRAQHEALSPRDRVAAPTGAQTIQEELYGVYIAHDEYGRPIIEDLSDFDEIEFAKRGLGMEFGVEPAVEMDGMSLTREDI